MKLQYKLALFFFRFQNGITLLYLCSVARKSTKDCIVDIQIMFFIRKNDYDRQTNVTMISSESSIEQQRRSNWHAVINLELNMPLDWTTSVNLASCFLVNRRNSEKLFHQVNKQRKTYAHTIGKFGKNQVKII